ncbi:hypothetical protein GCM10027343_17360 [Noviherbaspirillum agri]
MRAASIVSVVVITDDGISNDDRTLGDGCRGADRNGAGSQPDTDSGAGDSDSSRCDCDGNTPADGKQCRHAGATKK